MQIYYIVPHSDRPSWGLGIIYSHVAMLVKNGFSAYIIKEAELKVPDWLELDVPVKNVGYLKANIKPTDILVVPEAHINFEGLKALKCRKIVFVQNCAYIFENMPKAEDHVSLGFEHVMIIMPHLEPIIKRHFKLPYSTIPPFVADYFFKEDMGMIRKKQVLIYPKHQQIDYSIVRHILDRHISQSNTGWFKNLMTKENWKLVELKGLTHKQVAKYMKESAFFVSLNTFEALNTSVPEAMAGGTVVFCYDGFGPKDFLRDRENAMVFNNNEAYKLADTLCDWIDDFELRSAEFRLMQQNGFSTAMQYKKELTEIKLIEFFQSYINPKN